MVLTYNLLSLPALVLLLVVVNLFAGISFIITYLFRRYLQPVPKTKCDIMGDIYGLLGGIYGLLMGFVAILVWGDYNDTSTDTAKEGSLAVGFYREMRFFPDSIKVQPLKKSYLAFVHSVLEDEYPKMETMKPFTDTDQRYIDEVYKQLELLNISDSRSNKMVEHLNELAMYRNLRQIGAFADIPIVIWVPLLSGYLVLMVFALFLDIESSRRHLLINSLVGAFVGLIIYIILLVNHPFSGAMKIEPDQYRTILRMEKELR